jgi:hypothetical protein
MPYFRKIKADSKFYLKYLELLRGEGKEAELGAAVADFNPAFDFVQAYLWQFLLANYY